MENITANIDGQVRTRVFDGRAHLVAPVVLLVEGVHTGMWGVPVYYSPEALRESAYLWDGTPVTINHPRDEQDQATSANQPDVLDAIRVGQLFNVWFDDNSNKLKGEIWIDTEKTRRISPESLDAIQAGSPLEVSTGLYFDQDSTPGDWSGEHYEAAVSNFRPDHLALLPDAVGACSWADGCGIRANKKTKGDMRMSENIRESGLIDKLKTVVRDFAAALGLTTHEASHEDIRGQLQAQLDPMDNGGWVHFVRDIYDDYFIYEARYRGENPSEDVVAGAQKFYRRGYNVAEDEQAAMKDDAAEVREVREWVAMSAKPDKKADNNHKPIHEEESNMEKKKEIIDELIANEKSQFVEDDRKALEGLTEEQIKKIAPCTNEDPPPEKEPEKAPVKPLEPNPPEPTPPDPKPEDNKQPVTVDEYVAKAPPDVASFLKRAVAAENAKKEAIVKELVANKRCNFTEEQLKAKDVTELQQLAELANVEVDFTGRSGAPATTEPEALTMPKTFEKVT